MAAGEQLGRLFEDSQTLTLNEPLQWQVLPKNAVLNPADFANNGLAAAFALLAEKQTIDLSQGKEAWLRFAVPATANPQMWYLRIPRFNVQRVTFYFQNEKQQWMQLEAGEDIPMNQWPLLTRNPSFELSTRVDKPQQFYLKFENRNTITERPQLISPGDYIDGAQRVGTLSGLMFGLFGLLTLLGLLTARLYRNNQYAWFALMVGMLLLAQLTLLGYSGMRIWPASVYLNKVMPVLLPLLTVAAATWFTTQVSYSRNSAPIIFKISIFLMVTLFCLVVGFAILVERFPREVIPPLVAAALLWNVGSMVWLAWRTQAWLWFVVAGFGPLTIAMMARLAYNLGWLAHAELAQLFGVITGCLGMMVVYAGMILRSRESYAAVERESALAHTDISTGLSLPRIINVRLPQVLTRSKRFGKPCGVAMVHWLGYENQLAPMSSAQRGAVLAHFGARLRRLARDIDTVARIDNDHFIFLVESPITREVLNELGIKILSTCMRPSVQLGGGDVFNVHVALAITSGAGTTAKDVLESLRTRLEHMDINTPRRVQFVDSALSTRPPGEGADSTGSTLSREEIVAKINAIEANPILPTLAPRTAPDPLASMVGSTQSRSGNSSLHSKTASSVPNTKR
jgi:two-component system, sensor histidine kinase LadS